MFDFEIRLGCERVNTQLQVFLLDNNFEGQWYI